MKFKASGSVGRVKALVAGGGDAAGKAPYGHGVVLQALGHAAVGHHGADFHWVFAEQKGQRIGVVHYDVQHHTAACGGPVQAPTLQMCGQIYRVLHAHRYYLAQGAGAKVFAHGAVRAVVT